MTTTPPVVPDPPEHDDEDGVEDFDAFFQQYIADRVPARCRIRGILVTAPVDTPVAVELRMDRAADSKEVEYLLGLLVGEEQMKALVDAGLGEEELQLLLIWAQVNASGERLTLPEVAARIAERDAKADEAGKAPTNRAERRRRSRTK